MFARSVFSNPFQPFTFGANPFTTGTGYGGIPPLASQIGGYNPLLPFLTPPLNAVGAFGGYSPVPPQIGGYGINPYQVNPLMGGVPISAAHLLAGLTPAIPPAINPLIAAQLAALNPIGLSNLTPQLWGQQFGQQFNPGQQFGQQFNPGQQFGQQFNPQQFGQQFNPGQINPLFQAVGNEANYFGQTPFGNQIGWSNITSPFNAPFNPYGQAPTGGFPGQALHNLTPSPYQTQDPYTSTLLAQQRLPIRPLAGSQQFDPYQIGLSGILGAGVNQATDLQSALAQAQLMAQCGVNPIQQMSRAYSPVNWTGSPYSMGQTAQTGQAGVPLNVQ
jgi:hypothetical protein